MSYSNPRSPVFFRWQPQGSGRWALHPHGSGGELGFGAALHSHQEALCRQAGGEGWDQGRHFETVNFADVSFDWWLWEVSDLERSPSPPGIAGQREKRRIMVSAAETDCQMMVGWWVLPLSENLHWFCFFLHPSLPHVFFPCAWSIIDISVCLSMSVFLFVFFDVAQVSGVLNSGQFFSSVSFFLLNYSNCQTIQETKKM